MPGFVWFPQLVLRAVLYGCKVSRGSDCSRKIYTDIQRIQVNIVLGDPEVTANFCTVIFRIRIGKVASFEVCICGNFWVIQYVNNAVPDGGLTSSSSSDTSASSDFSSSNHLHFKFTTYCMSKKSWPVLYCNLLRKDYWAVMNIYIFNCLKILTDCFRDSGIRAAPFSRFFSSSVYN